MKNFYKMISIVLQPLLMPVYGIILLMNMDVFSYFPISWKLIAIAGTFLFTALLPAAPILWMMKRGEVNDLFISRREERTLPYVFSIIAYIFWAFFLWYTLGLPMFMVGMGIGAAISILLVALINLKWKISAHLSGIGGVVGGVFGICYRMQINPIWLFILVLFLSALVALSRIQLKAHTPAQTGAGFIVGFVSIFFPCLLL